MLYILLACFYCWKMKKEMSSFPLEYWKQFRVAETLGLSENSFYLRT